MHISNSTKTVLLSAALIIGGGLIALAAWGSPAQAADKGGPSIFEDSLQAPKKTKWTGFWIGLVGSYDMQSTQVGGVLNIDDKDLGYGIAAGGDYQFKGTNIVAGIMVDYLKHNTGTPLSAMDGSWSVAGRLGFVVGETTLLYGLAGYTVEDINGPLSTLNLDKGFTAGLGIESFVTKHIAVKAEYRWVDEGSAGGGMVESSSQSLRAGINFRF